MNAQPMKETPFAPMWPDPDFRFLKTEKPPAPKLLLRDVLSPRLAEWVEQAAESKGAPADYVFAAMLAATGATIGNTRWALVWQGWAEPPPVLSVASVLSEGGWPAPSRAHGLEPDPSAYLDLLRHHGPATYGAMADALGRRATRAWQAETRRKATGQASIDKCGNV